MFPSGDPRVAAYSRLLASSYERWTGKSLASDVRPQALYEAPFVLVSHGIQPDPIFCYANRAAQKIWEMSWNTFTKLPSRLSAEPDAQEERQRLLALAEKQGYVDHYQGVRITSGGKRFRIRNCLLWNVVDGDVRVGQAAVFSQVEWL